MYIASERARDTAGRDDAARRTRSSRPHPARRTGRRRSRRTRTCSTLFDAMAGSRLLDIQARRMRERGQGFYTIGSAGHESNAFVADALRPTDPALLHYRSGGFFLMRALQAGRSLRRRAARRPARHVGGHRRPGLRRPAQGLGRRLARRHPADLDDRLAPAPCGRRRVRDRPRPAARRRHPIWPDDAVAVCSFGDASAQPLDGGRRAEHRRLLRRAGPADAARARVRGQRPRHLGAVARRLGGAPPRNVPGSGTCPRDGDDPDAVAAAAHEAVEHRARGERRPALLHLRTVRFLGHAGTDVEIGLPHRRPRSPPTAIATRCWRWPGGSAVSTWRPATTRSRRRVAELAAEVEAEPKLTERGRGHRAAGAAPGATVPGRRAAARPSPAPEDAGRMTLAQCINATLADALAARPEMLVFGEDVGRKGGVYGLTRGLQQRFGAPRVFDTLLDEQSILGPGAGPRRQRAAADARDPVPGLPAQRRGPAARRGGQPALLLQRRLHESDGGAHRRPRLPEGLRRPLPQRRRGGRAARHPRPGRRRAGAPRGRRRRCCAPAWRPPPTPAR